VHSSRILPDVFAGIDPGQKLNVLDVGIGSPSTLEFLEPYSAKVFFLDLHPRDGETDAEKLAPYADTLFDVCLFWDLLQYLDADRLTSLSDALTPHIYSDTRGYCIWDVGAATRQQRSTYKLLAQDQLALAESSPADMREWSYCDFSEDFDTFHIARDCLSADGHLELLLQVD
jgi:hypothetical protein